MSRWILVVLICLSGCTSHLPLEDFGTVEEFSLMERSGQTVSLKELQGKVWVASFIFTRCGTVCPQLCGSLAKLQHDLAGQDDVRLVSISVDPDHDTPKVLQEFAARYQADPKRWLFLTGKRAAVYDLIRHSFALAVEQNEGTARTPGNEVTHSSRLALVDRRGHIRGYFDGRLVDEEGRANADLTRLRDQITALLREKP